MISVFHIGAGGGKRPQTVLLWKQEFVIMTGSDFPRGNNRDSHLLLNRFWTWFVVSTVPISWFLSQQRRNHYRHHIKPIWDAVSPGKSREQWKLLSWNWESNKWKEQKFCNSHTTIYVFSLFFSLFSSLFGLPVSSPAAGTSVQSTVTSLRPELLRFRFIILHVQLWWSAATEPLEAWLTLNPVASEPAISW